MEREKVLVPIKLSPKKEEERPLRPVAELPDDYYRRERRELPRRWMVNG